MAMGMTTLEARIKRLEKQVKRARRRGVALPLPTTEQTRTILKMMVEAGLPLPGGLDDVLGRVKSAETPTGESHDLGQRRAS